MIKPGEVTDHRFVVAVIAFADLHRRNLCQAHFQVPPEGVLVERLAAGLHMALRTKKRAQGEADATAAGRGPQLEGGRGLL